jgi:catechol 2,3-dioxygenase-like lactoylglutathione lyase family enzyme
MRLGYVIAYVPDVAAAVEFYERAFGLARRFVDGGGLYAEMETGGTALAFAGEPMAEKSGLPIRHNRPGDAPPGIEIALVTDDVPAAVERATAAGASLAKAAERKPWGQTVAYVRDLNGLLIELCTPVSGQG